MLRDEYDLVVLGAGPTGLTAALKAANFGRSVLIVDATPKRQVQFTGPTGLFSKALRDSAKKVDVITLRNMGLRDVTVWRQVKEMTSDVMRNTGLSNLKAVQLGRIPHLRGTARLLGQGRVQVTYLDSDRTTEVRGKRVLVATGSRPYRLPAIPYDDRAVFDSDTIRALDFLPKTVCIVGAGIIAIEFAKIFAQLDCRVTMLVRQRSLDVALRRIGVDEDIALNLQKDLCLNKVRIIFDVETHTISNPDPSSARPMRVELKRASTGEKLPKSDIRCDVLMTATGRAANTGGLGLGEAGVELDADGTVLVDANLETSLKGVYAAGDVLGAPSLASTGIEQAGYAVSKMFGRSRVTGGGWAGGGEEAEGGRDPRSLLANPLQYPVGIWTIPEVAFIGRTKARALEDGYHSVGEGVAEYSGSIRGKVQGVSIGILKLVFSKPDGRILGVHILGEDACELIHYGTALAQSGKTVWDVLGTVFTAVTFHELFRTAAQDAVNQLEEDGWRALVEGLADPNEEEEGEHGAIPPHKLRTRLERLGLDPLDVNDIMREAQPKGASLCTFRAVLSAVTKYRIPASESEGGEGGGERAALFGGFAMPAWLQ